MEENKRLPRSTPEEQGITSSGLLEFIGAVNKDAAEKRAQELHSFMLLRHGHVVAEGWWSPYEARRPHMLYSLSKSFTSTAVGFAVSEGLLSLDDRVVSFFPGELPEKTGENLNAMRVRHLLSMSTGHAPDTTEYLLAREDGDWVKGFFSVPVEFPPGTHFLYNTGATYILSAILQKLTGQRLIDYLQPRLFEPLGIEDAAWETCPKGVNTGGFGLSVRTEDIACFGQLYLNKGIWNGRRILPEAWVEDATRSHIANGSEEDSDWAQGYGFQFWRCRNGAYRGDGAFGQYCVVLPEQDAVIAITGGVENMQLVLDYIWKLLLPSMKDRAIPADDTAREELERRLWALELSVPPGLPNASAAARVSGRRYKMEENSRNYGAIQFDFTEAACTLTILENSGEVRRIDCGIGTWAEGEAIFGGRPQRIVTRGRWTKDDTFVITMRFIETPHYDTITCGFEGDELRMEVCVNVSFDPVEAVIIRGTEDR